MLYINAIFVINEQSPLNIKKTITYGVGNPIPGLGQALKCGGVKPDRNPPSLDNWISDNNTEKKTNYDQKKNLHIFASN